jgi:hypothetical protein
MRHTVSGDLEIADDSAAWTSIGSASFLVVLVGRGVGHRRGQVVART